MTISSTVNAAVDTGEIGETMAWIDAHPACDVRSDRRLLVLRVVGPSLGHDLVELEVSAIVAAPKAEERIENGIPAGWHADTIARSRSGCTTSALAGHPVTTTPARTKSESRTTR